MRIPQYNAGRGLGLAYNLWQATTAVSSFPTFVVGVLNLWPLWELKIKDIIPWMTFPIFIIIAPLVAFGVGTLFYVFVQPSALAYQSDQAYRHNNPVAMDLQEIKLNLKKHMGKEYEEIK